MKLIPTQEAHKARRDANAERRQLQRDLSSYSTQADIHDLLSAVARSEGPKADEIRSILLDNLRRCA